MKVLQACKFAVDHSPADERRFRSHAGASRFAWNWGLARCKERYAAEKKWYSAAELHKLWNAEKKANPDLAWWPENSKCVYQEAFRNLERALKGFVKSKKGQRNGKRLGFPKRKKKGRCRDSFRFGAGVMRCSDGTVTLPRLGTIRTHEPTVELARKIEDGSARILSATVSRTAQRWFVSFTVEVEQEASGSHARPGSAVGVDLGVKTLLTGVDDRGRVIEIAGRKPLRASLRKLRRASRDHSRRQEGSRNRRKSAARLGRVHARVANVRADSLHKATTMLARAVADQGFGAVRRILGYKTTWNGGTLLVADRWYPSSKTCSGCGGRKPSLTLAERTYECESCGLVLDRDVNAARNLLSLAASGAERLNACRGTIRSGSAGHVPLKQEPGASHEGQTGTAANQAAAA